MSPAELDIEQPGALEDYLRAAGRLAPGACVTISRLAGGVSNRTMLVKGPGIAWVVKQALAKLRVKVDWFSDPARIEREAAGMRVLYELAPHGSITRPLFEDAANHLMAMEAVPEPHENWKTLLLAGTVERTHVEQFAALLGNVHAKSAARREEFARDFAERRFFESLRLEPYYAYTAGQVPAAVDFLRKLIDQTMSRRDTLVHGDYSPKNVLVHAGRVVLLDHEVIHFGEPAFDLGFAMTHLLSKAHHVHGDRTLFAEATLDFWRTYRQTLGPAEWNADLEERAVHHTLGCLLARVAGRSPLEYLGEPERALQRGVVVALMADTPRTIDSLVARFIAGIESPNGAISNSQGRKPLESGPRDASPGGAT
jgi:5-methylthioribose kinase